MVESKEGETDDHCGQRSELNESTAACRAIAAVGCAVCWRSGESEVWCGRSVGWVVRGSGSGGGGDVGRYGVSWLTRGRGVAWQESSQ